MIRLYGHSRAYGSFAQVTRGLRTALEDAELLAGYVPIDSGFDDTEDYPGALAPVSVNAGAPSAVAWAHSIGHHKKRWLMLAPNSDRTPPGLVKRIPQLLDGLLTPSSWGAQVLRSELPQFPILVCPHGVHPEYQPIAERHEALGKAFAEERFHVLHLTSTASERKGTRELVRAWRLLMDSGWLPPLSKLYLVVPTGGLEFWRMFVTGQKLDESVYVLDEVHGRRPVEQNAFYQYFHVVCQPSRAEGFGLTPLEARASGVPVVATTEATGHMQHMNCATPGVVHVPTGPDAPIDDGPGCRAPSLQPAAVEAALAWSFSHWPELHAQALAAAPAVGQQWSWQAQSGPVLRSLVVL